MNLVVLVPSQTAFHVSYIMSLYQLIPMMKEMVSKQVSKQLFSNIPSDYLGSQNPHLSSYQLAYGLT